MMPHTLPCGTISKLLTVSIDSVPIMLSSTSVEVNLADLPPPLPLPDVSDYIE
jgi:hypothetical protein